MEAGDVAHQVVEAVAGDLAGGVEVDAVEGLHDVGVVGDVKVGDHRVAVLLHFDVAAVVLADRDRGVDHLGDVHHDRGDLFGQLLLLDFQLFQLLRLGGNLRLEGLGLFLLALGHQAADLFGELVPLGAEGAGLLLGLAGFGVQLDDLVDHRQLIVLEFLFDVLLDLVGVGPYKFDIKHGDSFLSVYFCILDRGGGYSSSPSWFSIFSPVIWPSTWAIACKSSLEK